MTTSTPSQARRSGTSTRRGGWRLIAAALIACALVAGAVWWATAPLRAQAALAERSHRLLEGLLDGDALAIAQLVEARTYAGTVDTSQLTRAGAEAALGAPVRVRTHTVVERRYSAETVSTVSGPRGSFEFTIPYSRSFRADAWEQQQVAFPRVAVAPRGARPPGQIVVNGLATDYPQGSSDVTLALWPSPSTTLTFPDDGGYGWEAAELGRVPASSLSSPSGSSVTFTAIPLATPLPESRRKAEAAVRTWVKEGLTRLERSPSEELSNAPIAATVPPLDGRRGTNPALRRLHTEVLAMPELTFPEQGNIAPSAQSGLPGAALRGGRVKITGQWLDGATWRDFTDVRSVNVDGTFSSDFSAFSGGR